MKRYARNTLATDQNKMFKPIDVFIASSNTKRDPCKIPRPRTFYKNDERKEINPKTKHLGWKTKADHWPEADAGTNGKKTETFEHQNERVVIRSDATDAMLSKLAENLAAKNRSANDSDNSPFTHHLNVISSQIQFLQTEVESSRNETKNLKEILSEVQLSYQKRDLLVNMMKKALMKLKDDICANKEEAHKEFPKRKELLEIVQSALLDFDKAQTDKNLIFQNGIKKSLLMEVSKVVEDVKYLRHTYVNSIEKGLKGVNFPSASKYEPKLEFLYLDTRDLLSQLKVEISKIRSEIHKLTQENADLTALLRKSKKVESSDVSLFFLASERDPFKRGNGPGKSGNDSGQNFFLQYLKHLEEDVHVMRKEIDALKKQKKPLSKRTKEEPVAGRPKNRSKFPRTQFHKKLGKYPLKGDSEIEDFDNQLEIMSEALDSLNRKSQFENIRSASENRSTSDTILECVSGEGKLGLRGGFSGCLCGRYQNEQGSPRKYSPKSHPRGCVKDGSLSVRIKDDKLGKLDRALFVLSKRDIQLLIRFLEKLKSNHDEMKVSLDSCFSKLEIKALIKQIEKEIIKIHGEVASLSRTASLTDNKLSALEGRWQSKMDAMDIKRNCDGKCCSDVKKDVSQSIDEMKRNLKNTDLALKIIRDKIDEMVKASPRCASRRCKEGKQLETEICVLRRSCAEMDVKVNKICEKQKIIMNDIKQCCVLESKLEYQIRKTTKLEVKMDKMETLMNIEHGDRHCLKALSPKGKTEDDGGKCQMRRVKSLVGGESKCPKQEGPFQTIGEIVNVLQDKFVSVYYFEQFVTEIWGQIGCSNVSREEISEVGRLKCVLEEHKTKISTLEETIFFLRVKIENGEERSSQIRESLKCLQVKTNSNEKKTKEQGGQILMASGTLKNVSATNDEINKCLQRVNCHLDSLKQVWTSEVMKTHTDLKDLNKQQRQVVGDYSNINNQLKENSVLYKEIKHRLVDLEDNVSILQETFTPGYEFQALHERVSCLYDLFKSSYPGGRKTPERGGGKVLGKGDMDVKRADEARLGLPYQFRPHYYPEHSVSIEVPHCGHVNILIKGDLVEIQSRLVMFLLHDAGSTPKHLLSLFSHPDVYRMKQLPVYVSLDFIGLNKDSERPATSVANIAQDIPFIMSMLQVDKILVFGDGVGGDVALRFAAQERAKCYGMILLNPSVSYASERAEALEFLKTLMDRPVGEDDILALHRFLRPIWNEWSKCENMGSICSVMQKYKSRLVMDSASQISLGYWNSYRIAPEPSLQDLQSIQLPTLILTDVKNINHRGCIELSRKIDGSCMKEIEMPEELVENSKREFLSIIFNFLNNIKENVGNRE